MKFLRLLCEFLFDHDEFLNQRERKKYREAVARGEKAKMPVFDYRGGGRISVDVCDIVATPRFREQCEAVRQIFAEQHATSSGARKK